MPAELLECASLRDLCLEDNVIDSLALLEALPGLQRLTVGDNSITTQDEALLTLDLRALDIRSNPISDHAPLAKLPHLVELARGTVQPEVDRDEDFLHNGAFFAVDTGDRRNAVYEWVQAAESPHKVHDEFDAFLNNLVPI